MSSDPKAMNPESRNPTGSDAVVRPASANAPREWRGIEEFKNQPEFLAAREGEFKDSDLPNAPGRLLSSGVNAIPNSEQTARPRPWEAWLRHADLREQLSETQNFVQLAPTGSAKPPKEGKDGIDRRDLLKIMAATAATAGLSACTILPDEHIVPYVRQPEDIIPGKPLFYATSMTQQGVATGLLVESHMGRPTKIEGNPEHPGSLGGTDVFLQASVLGVYDPARSQTVLYNGNISSWEQFVAQMRDQKAGLAQSGAGLYLLTETISSPSFSAQIQKLMKQFPKAKWHQYEPCHRDSAFEGARLAFGKPVNTVYRFDQANVIVSLDSDFLVSGPGHVRHARDFSSRRSIDGTKQNLNRLYTAETMPTSTGAMADHRLRMRASEVEAFARGLAAAIGIALPGGTGSQSAVPHETVQAIARDLTRNRGASLVIAGEQQPPIVHALAHAMNEALQNVGKTLYYTQPLETNPVNQTESLRDLVNDLNAGKVTLLVILSGNPVYNAPVDFNFASALMKAPLRVYSGLYRNETAELCNWHIPAAHYLESWGDAPAYDGTIGIQQPLIAPLYGGHSDYEVIATLTGDDGVSTHDIVKGYWQAQGVSKGQNFEDFWQVTLHDGVLANTALPQAAAPLQRDFLQQPPAASHVQANEFEMTFRADPTIFDGRWANNFWLQEIPKPITRITWDNAVMMSPATAGKNNLNHGDYVTLRYGGREVSGGVFLAIGHADNAITVHLGYGRQRMYTPYIQVGPGGDMGKDAELGPVYGFNAYALRTSTAPWIADGPVQIANTGKKYTFATVQYQYLIDNKGVESDDESVNAFRRELVQVATLDEFRRDPNFAQVPETTEHKSLSLYQNYNYGTGYAWGLSVDLNKCVGCNACVVACVSENNIATVGKDEVDRGRAMHWIRIDTYFHGGLETPEMYFEPLPCMQCENAPCEYVCPVGATTHSSEGLNDMTYNRCVGTRYCSNNCPYKVRRFNFFLFSDYTTPSLYGVRNPNVTVRSRGVMEKCTYCVQRINAAKIRSAEEDRTIRDLEIQTACQQACPAGAIMFGNINDKKSHIARWKAQPRNYTLLADLNTRPRTTYLARVRNPNPEIAG
ncbi:MAG TPA: 4Fe-4S dicluster domain-containing protein [Candidatus Acidoferrales bacterium]|nr:4Fe-4S dicluster domain-containing protein [Candidatus Acidoferrales bacterium]